MPGYYIFVPPFVPHREENPDPDNPAMTIYAEAWSD